MLGRLGTSDNDDVMYLTSAWTFLETGRFVYHDVNTPSVFIMPGHTLLLAGMSLVFGKMGAMTAFRLFQALLQALSIVILYRIGEELFSSKVGITACLISLVYPPNYASTGLILTEVEFKFLLLLLVLTSIKALRTRSSRWYAIGGLVWGLACLFRPTIALYPILILIMWLRHRYTYREMLRFTAVTVTVFSLVLLPWWLRNATTFHRFIPLTKASGNPFLQGTYINYDQSRDYTPYVDSTEGVDAIELDQIELATGKTHLATYFWRRPVAYVWWYTVGKSWYLWSDAYYWVDVFGIPAYLVTVLHGLIMVGSFIGARAVLNKKHSDALLLVLVAAYFTMTHLPFYTCSRYAYPVMPLVILLTSAAYHGPFRQLTVFWSREGKGTLTQEIGEGV